jgi:hypothetical protein
MLKTAIEFRVLRRDSRESFWGQCEDIAGSYDPSCEGLSVAQKCAHLAEHDAEPDQPEHDDRNAKVSQVLDGNIDGVLGPG